MSRLPATRQTARTEATRAKLLCAALTVFVRDGFAAASIDDIADVAGYTRGAFYAHFESKEDLFLALYEQHFHRHMAEIHAVLDGPGDLREKLAAIGDFYCNRADDQSWALLVVEFRLHAIRNPSVHKRLTAYTKLHDVRAEQLTAALFRDLQPPLPFRPETLSPIFMALFYGLMIESLFRPAELRREELRTILGQVFNRLTGLDG